MVPNRECLQLQSGETPVPCRSNQNYYPGKGWCRLMTCEARMVLESPDLLAKVLGPAQARLFGPDNRSVRQTIFHRVCPGTENPEGGVENYLEIIKSR